MQDQDGGDVQGDCRIFLQFHRWATRKYDWDSRGHATVDLIRIDVRQSNQEVRQWFVESKCGESCRNLSRQPLALNFN